MTVENVRFDQPATVAAGRTARGVLQGAAGRAGFFVFGYLATIILARGLGPVDYGIYGVIISVLVCIEQIARFAIASAAAKLIPQADEASVAVEQTAVFLSFCLFILLFFLLWFAAPMLADLFDLPDSGTLLFRIAALDLPFFGMYAAYRGVLQGHREFLSISIADVLYSATKLGGVLVLVALWLSVPGALIVNILGSVGALLFVLSRISIKILQPAYNLTGPLLRFALPLGLYMLALQTLWNLDLWFLKALTPANESTTIGFYVAARNVAIVPGVILLVVSDVLLPSLSHAFAKNDTGLSHRYLQGGVRFLCVMVLPIALLFMLTAEEIMVLLYSKSYGEGGVFLRILIFYAISLAFIDLFASALNAHDKPYLSAATLFGVIPVAVFLNIFLIVSYGAVGAAYASALTGFLGAVTLGVLVYRRFGSPIRFRTFLNVIIAVVLMAGVASQLTLMGPSLAISYLGCLGIYVLALVLLGEVTWEDLEPLAFWQSRLS
jgi:O-antigen/teichoic acid export membrane protein